MHILRAVHALAPPPKEGEAEAYRAANPPGRKRKNPNGNTDDGVPVFPTLADVMTDKAFINLGAKAATIMARKRDYVAADVTIQALLHFHGRPS